MNMEFRNVLTSRLHSFLPSLYYISQGKTAENHLQNIEKVCENGVRLVQLRLKNVSLNEYKKTAQKAKEICDTYKATLLINDNVEVAKSINAEGIHLGKDDMCPLEARSVLTNEIIIGGTANTLEDCLQLIDKKVDYIGLGPFRFTETKKKLSPILGLEGYQKIITALQKQGCHIPIYAIGGIKTEDIDALFNTGVYGIAVSGLLTNTNEITSKQVVGKCVR